MESIGKVGAPGRGWRGRAWPDTPGYLMWKAAFNLRRLLERELSPERLKAKHFGLMALLEQRGPLSQRAIGEALEVDRSSLVGFLDELERLGYARRRPHPGDRRAHLIALTPQGRRTLRRALALANRVETRLWGGVPARRQAAFEAELRRVAQFGLEGDERGDDTPRRAGAYSKQPEGKR